MKHSRFRTKPRTMPDKPNKRAIYATLFEILIYFILLISFIYFYMKDQMSDYMAGRSTITSRFGIAEVLEFPTITICMKPGTKPSAAEEFGFVKLNDIFNKEVENSTLKLNERFEKLSYKLNEDFEIYLNWHKDRLEIGENERNWNQVYDLQPIRTQHHGVCYKMEPKFEVKKVSVYLHLKVVLSPKLLDIDKPKGFDLFLTSNKSWNGVTYELWPQYQPTRISLDFNNDQIGYRLNVVELNYQSGVEDAIACQDLLTSKANW